MEEQQLGNLRVQGEPGALARPGGALGWEHPRVTC